MFVSRLCICLVVLAGVVSCSRVEDSRHLRWDPPKFCRDMDCPEFQVVQKVSGYELRHYMPGKWITTNITDKPWDSAVKDGYKLLDDYRGGNNKNKTKIAETVPYFTLFYPSGDRQVKAYYTIEYFVPYEHQESPPSPTTDTVNIVHVPAMDVWVKSFGGFPGQKDIVDKAWDFAAELKQQGRQLYDDEFFGFAQYDPVTTLIHRHNEIWMFSKEKPANKD